ncbi:helix-turn-helix domain-containing protein [Thalassomonas haliotis]
MRLSRNYTTAEMAEKLGVSRITYERYESGESRISWNAGLNLTMWCGYDVTAFLKQMEKLKLEFSQYKEQNDETTPNASRASAKKNHLRQTAKNVNPDNS